jgi:hypothetical protein
VTDPVERARKVLFEWWHSPHELDKALRALLAHVERLEAEREQMVHDIEVLSRALAPHLAHDLSAREGE